MTTEAAVHPNITYSAEELTKRLLKMVDEPGETALTLRVIIRDGVPRKWKFQAEDEPCPQRTI